MERESSFQVGEWQVRPPVNEIESGGVIRHLEPKAMDVLCYLADHAGEVLHKERLIQAVWPDTFVTDEVLTNAISQLRKAFEDDPADPRYIRTIPRRGYQLVAEARFPEEPVSKPSRYRLGHKLGEGGMGEVWLAEDRELQRRVALKFLRPEKEGEEVWHRRLGREARAAAALDHPFICKVYETGTLDSRSFIAMEYIEGEKLSDRLTKGPMPLAEALHIALEMTEALEVAHRHGIVHRDIKPSNVIVTEQGHVKITDFGLAKRTRRPGSDESVTAVSKVLQTEEGTIVGTAAYLSPEQAEGKEVDARSDIFAFGSVLYEIVTGRRAFEGDSWMATATAILHQEPNPASSLRPSVPPDLEKLIHRCLRKDPGKRPQHMDDVRVALEEIKEDSDSGKLTAGTPTQRRTRASLWLLTILPAVVVLAVAIWLWVGWRPTAGPEMPLPTPLTDYPGSELTPSFSPDGNFVAFEWCHGMTLQHCDIYIKQIGVEPPVQFSSDPAVECCPAWSPDGLFIAFLRRLAAGKMAAVLVPRSGGQEKVVGEFDEPHLWPIMSFQSLDWTPDSKWLVIRSSESSGAGRGLFLLSPETLEKRRLTEGDDASPAFSPDGRTLAFSRWSIGRSDLYLLRLGVDYEPQGEQQIPNSTGDPMILAPAWTPDGKEIVFSSMSNNANNLWRMPADASAGPRRLPVASADPFIAAVSRQGDRLAYAVPSFNYEIWRIDLRGPSQTSPIPFQLIRSNRNAALPAYSPDGGRIAFVWDVTGQFEISVCNSDGSNAVQLTSMERGVSSPIWSPDGRSIAFASSASGNPDIYVISANGGSPRRLTSDPAKADWPFWSRDGRWIYFRSPRSGRSEVWRIPSDGGDAVQMTRNGGDQPQESPDGKFLYYWKGDRYPEECSIWRMPSGGGEETRVFDSLECGRGFSVGEQGIYYFEGPDEKGRMEMCFQEFATGQTRRILQLDQSPWSMAASPDGLTILYTALEGEGCDLMLIDNFH